MRLSGAGFLWTSLFLAGMTVSLRLNRRVQILNKTFLMINQFKTEIEFLSLPLPMIIKKLCESELFKELDFLFVCLDKLFACDDFPAAWSNSVDSSQLPFKKHEKEKLRQLCLILGTSDRESQSQVLELYCEYFRSFCNEAEEYKKKYSNCAVVCGAFFGCLMFVLLL